MLLTQSSRGAAKGPAPMKPNSLSCSLAQAWLSIAVLALFAFPSSEAGSGGSVPDMIGRGKLIPISEPVTAPTELVGDPSTIATPTGAGIPCSSPAPSVLPPPGTNVTELAALPGWLAGRFHDGVRSPAGTATKLFVIRSVGARECYKRAVCDHAGDGVKYLSWVAITNALTKGHCQLFSEDVCSAVAAGPQSNRVMPFIPGARNWVSASTSQPTEDPSTFC